MNATIKVHTKIAVFLSECWFIGFSLIFIKAYLYRLTLRLLTRKSECVAKSSSLVPMFSSEKSRALIGPEISVGEWLVGLTFPMRGGFTGAATP